VDSPEKHVPAGQILTTVSHAWILTDLAASLMEVVQHAIRGIQTPFGDEI
jgi:hypothetical protein